MQEILSLPFPHAPSKPSRQQASGYFRFNDTRCKWQSLHYSVLLPQSWRIVDIPPEETAGRTQAILGLYKSISKIPAELEVSVIPLVREVAPAHWLEMILRLRGQQIVERHDYDSPGGLCSEFLTIAGDSTESVVSRWSALKDGHVEGGRLFVLQTRTPVAHYPACVEAFLHIHSGFFLLHPGALPYVERLLSHSRAAPGDFFFYYPPQQS